MLCQVTSVVPNSLDPMDSSLPWDFPGKNTGVGCHFLLQGSNPGIKPESSVSTALQADSLPLGHQGSPYHP